MAKKRSSIDWMLDDENGEDLPEMVHEIVAIARYVTSHVRDGDSGVVIRAIVDVLYLNKQ